MIDTKPPRRQPFSCARCGRPIPYVIVDGKRVYDPAKAPTLGIVRCFVCSALDAAWRADDRH